MCTYVIYISASRTFPVGKQYIMYVEKYKLT